MNRIPHHCGSMHAMGGNQASLCEPLAYLKREHGPLRRQMDAFALEAAEIGRDPAIADWLVQLEGLKEKVEAFVAELDPHSEREEGTLFPMMAKYIGRQVGPIAVMEYEHEAAKQSLKQFLQAVEQTKGPIGGEQAAAIASYAVSAHATLKDHFMKEENVLFPMAENMLNAEEKEELSRAYGLRG